MKIESSAVQLQAQHAALESTEVKESLHFRIGGREMTAEASGEAASGLFLSSEALSLSARGSAGASSSRNVTAAPKQGASFHGKNGGTCPLEDFKLELVKYFMLKVFGLKIVSGDEEAGAEAEGSAGTVQGNAGGTPVEAEQSVPSWGLEYHREESHTEFESTSFQAQGVVKTADGQEISFSAELNMSRSFVETSSVDVRAGQAALKDPLVLNFSGTAADLGSATFRFDLDADGEEDQVSTLGEGSVFLALDRNGDGTVNDGTELFGAKTGDGFAELSAYDEDKNLWIDENDSVFDKLRVWDVNDSGQSTLIALGQAGVGAIYLGSAETPFEIKDSANELMGEVKATGVFLKEEGGVGTVQQVDLKA